MDIKKIITLTINEFNDSQTEYEISNENNFLLFGQESSLDSLAIVNFLTKLEKNIYKNLSKEVDILNNIFSQNKDKITLSELEQFLKENLKQ